jgi:hypothetical protein
MLRWITVCLIWLITLPSYADSYSKLWGLVSYFSREGELLYAVEPQLRLVDKPGVYEQLLLNAAIGTAIKPEWQVWLGQTYSNYSQLNNIDEDVSNQVLDEYRVWEQLLWHRPFWDKYASRLRLEQRRAFENPTWAVRLRERFYWTLPVHGALYFAINDELFVNLKTVSWVPTSTLDQNRFYIGGQYQLTPNMGLNMSYMNQYIAKTPAEVNNGLVINLIVYA